VRTCACARPWPSARAAPDLRRSDPRTRETGHEPDATRGSPRAGRPGPPARDRRAHSRAAAAASTRPAGRAARSDGRAPRAHRHRRAAQHRPASHDLTRLRHPASVIKSCRRMLSTRVGVFHEVRTGPGSLGTFTGESVSTQRKDTAGSPVREGIPIEHPASACVPCPTTTRRETDAPTPAEARRDRTRLSTRARACWRLTGSHRSPCTRR
jgi:hypothetical protein